MSSDDKKKVDAIMVIEVLGRPPEFLIETLEGIIKTMSEEPGVVVKETRIREPAPLKEKPDFFSSFVEVEVETDEILYLAILIFKYMPAHVEVISPQYVNLTNSGFNDIFNELARRLHGYEEVARVLQTEKMILENQLKTILGEKEGTLPKAPEAEEAKIKKPRKPRAKKVKDEKAKEEKKEGEKTEVKEKSVDDIAKEIEEQIEEGVKEQG